MTDTVQHVLAPQALPDSPPDASALRSPSWLPLWITLLSFSAVLATTALFLPIKPVAENIQPTGLFMFALAALVCVTAALSDAATNRIPNPLTYTAALLGLLLNCLPVLARLFGFEKLDLWLGAAGPQQALLGFAAAAVFGLVSVAIRGMGVGDSKFIIAIASILGFSHACVALLSALCIATVYALINLAVAGRLNIVLRFAAQQLVDLVCLKKWTPLEAPDIVQDKGFRGKIPLAVPLAIGVTISRFIPLRILTFGLIDA